MPHQCTNCNRTFPDGSKDMLSGCPDCGGNKFQFRPAGTLEHDDSGDATADSASTSTDAATGTDDARAADATESTEATGPEQTDDRPSKEWVGLDGDESPDATDDEREDDIIEADETPIEADVEDRAQADARSATVTPDEVANAGSMPPDADSRVIEPQTDERPDMSDLREELNDQFESIKILSPGQYELNLMELYDRDEYIISLQEDGRYVIEVPDAWNDDDET